MEPSKPTWNTTNIVNVILVLPQKAETPSVEDLTVAIVAAITAALRKAGVY